nr:MAG TPA: hypothetical protein [Caudoviricetes sp.]
MSSNSLIKNLSHKSIFFTFPNSAYKFLLHT